jgi:hypothetical protein
MTAQTAAAALDLNDPVPQKVLLHGIDSNAAIRVVQVGTDGQIQLNLTGEGLALDVSVDGLESVLGTTAGAAVITDANGSIQQYLRGIIKQWLAGTLVIGTGSNTIGAVTNTALTNIGAGHYEAVAASQTDQVMGASGATGDYLQGLLIVPATTSPGAVQIKDGSGSAITVFTGGASSVSNLVPIYIPLAMTSGSGAWKITTGANVSAIGTGKFT